MRDRFCTFSPLELVPSLPGWILRNILVAGLYFPLPSDESCLLIFLRYAKKIPPLPLRLYIWILPDILSHTPQLFSEGPESFGSFPAPCPWCSLTYLSWPSLCIAYFPACQKAQVCKSPAPYLDTSTTARFNCRSTLRTCRQRTLVLSHHSEQDPACL